MIVDRYGGWFDDSGAFNDRGRFLADANTPFPERAMPPIKNSTILSQYRVKKPFKVDSGKIAPWFGQKGGANQYFTKNKTIGELIDSGHLELIDRKIIKCK
ncbi:TNT domain-containing protein [Zobellia sp. 1_MG-2023]|uniref:TNT domain-containing protein n=1 Tax=Zobellia sp. 1_MG-2023 TaxID=3062626 RepID=UPI0026E48057|nr:TNT domain-containing protein [Zobellia sp. 1_MG-2023]MDO6819043.1 TNT domain-containing protein [Zobellia sp. 1_MG-2023]